MYVDGDSGIDFVSLEINRRTGSLINVLGERGVGLSSFIIDEVEYDERTNTFLYYAKELGASNTMVLRRDEFEVL